MKILLLDDDSAVRQSVGRALMQMGHQVFMVESLVDARQQLSQQIPDVALLDLHLREGLSLPFVKDLNEKCPRIPVIFSTADPGNPAFLDPFFKEAVYSVIEKPVSLKRLKTVLEWAATNRQLAEKKEKTEAILATQKPDELKTYLQKWGWKKVVGFIIGVMLLLALLNQVFYAHQAAPSETESDGFSFSSIKKWMEKVDGYLKRDENREIEKRNSWFGK